jgi:hypothetical protein
MGGNGGGGGRSGRGGGGGGGGEPSITTSKKVETQVVNAEFVKANTKVSNGYELIQVKSGEWTYSGGKNLTSPMGKKLMAQGKHDMAASHWGGVKFFKSKSEANDAARKELLR